MPQPRWNIDVSLRKTLRQFYGPKANLAFAYLEKLGV